MVRPRRGPDPGRADLLGRRSRWRTSRGEKNKAYIHAGSATSDLTGAQCTPNTIHWVYDTYMLAQSTGGAMVKAGGDTWFFITADYAFGHALTRDITDFVRVPAARCWAGCARPSTTPISPRSWCRRRPPAPR